MFCLRSASIGAAASENTSRPVVLVVDDEAAVREVVSVVLSQAGFHTLAAESGPEALRVLERTSQVDLLFTDICMPGMDGFELAETAQKLRPGLDVLFTTGYTGRWPASGVPVLRKPYRVRSLIAAVQAAIGNEDDSRRVAVFSAEHRFKEELVQHT